MGVTRNTDKSDEKFVQNFSRSARRENIAHETKVGVEE
jgi:hypothetical protein